MTEQDKFGTEIKPSKPHLASWTDSPAADWADHRANPKGPSKLHPLTDRSKAPAITPSVPNSLRTGGKRGRGQGGGLSLRELQDNVAAPTAPTGPVEWNGRTTPKVNPLLESRARHDDRNRKRLRKS